MKRRIARKILNADYYFDTWYNPHTDDYIEVPHSGKHWYLYNRAVNSLHSKELRQIVNDYYEGLCEQLKIFNN